MLADFNASQKDQFYFLCIVKLEGQRFKSDRVTEKNPQFFPKQSLQNQILDALTKVHDPHSEFCSGSRTSVIQNRNHGHRTFHAPLPELIMTKMISTP